MPPPSGAKRVRCKWYNDLGYPRINPEKVKRGFPDPRGCRFPSQKCYYAHPDHPDWSSAALSPYIQPHEYPDGRVPATPDPDKWQLPSTTTISAPTAPASRLGKRKSLSRSRSPSRGRSIGRRSGGSVSRMRTPERRMNVKDEPRSPVLRPDYRKRSRSLSKDRGKERYGFSKTSALVNRVGPRRSISPYGGRLSGGGPGPGPGLGPRAPLRNYSRERDGDRDWERNRENDSRDKGGYYKQSDGELSRGEQGWKGKSTDWERDRERDKGWNRGDRRASDSTRFTPFTPYNKKQGFYSNRAANANTFSSINTRTAPPSPPPRPPPSAPTGPSAARTRAGNLSAKPTIIEGAGSGSGNGNEFGSGAETGAGSVLDRLFSRDPSLGSAPTETSAVSFKNLLTTLGLDPPNSAIDSNTGDSGSTGMSTKDQDKNLGAVLATSSGTVPKTEPVSPTTDLPPSSQQLPPPSDPQPLPPPLSAPPRPLSPISRSSIASSSASVLAPASNTSSSSSVLPEHVMSAAGLSVAMPPPATPSAFSTASSATLAGSFSATTPGPAPTSSYVVPTKPAFLAPSQTPENLKREELSREERALLWEKRIELLSEAIAAKRTLNERIADVKQLEALASPERTANLTAPVREQINTTLKAAQAQVEAAQERVKVAQQKVLELDFWPVRKRPGEYDPVKKGLLKIEEEEKERKLIEDAQEEIKDRMNGLGDAISKLEKQMQEVALLVSTRARPGASAESVSGSVPPPGADSMDWEPTDGPRGMKRRKTGDDGLYASDTGSVAHSPVSADPVRDRELRLLTHRISRLETSFHELENLYHQDEEHREDELTQLVEAHVDAVRSELVRGVKAKQGEKVKRVEQDLGQMDAEVRELGNEIAELYERLSGVMVLQVKLEEERARVQSERERLRATIEENKSQADNMEKQIADNIIETQGLRRRLLSLSSSTAPSQPNMQGVHAPSLENLTQALLPRLLDAVRADLEKKLQEQKTEVVRLLKEHTLGTTGSLTTGGSGAQQNQNQVSMKEALERAIKSPEVIAALHRSGALSAGANGNGNGNNNAVNGGGVEVNGASSNVLPSRTTPTPRP